MITKVCQFLDSEDSNSYNVSLYNKGFENSIGMSGELISRVHPSGVLAAMDFIDLNSEIDNYSSSNVNLQDIINSIPKNIINEIAIIYEAINSSSTLIINKTTMLKNIPVIPTGYDLVISREEGNTRNITLDAILALDSSILNDFLNNAILTIKDSFDLKGKINHNEFMILLNKFVRNINVFFLNNNSIEVR